MTPIVSQPKAEAAGPSRPDWPALLPSPDEIRGRLFRVEEEAKTLRKLLRLSLAHEEELASIRALEERANARR